jgi:hypothetical protein
MYRILLPGLLALALITSCSDKTTDSYLLIKGGTLINTSDRGTDNYDLENSYILIRDSLIVDVGIIGDNIDLPENCIELDARGKYILPGLIDGFGTINNQDYARAYLEAGVTSIVGVESIRRGELFTEGDPSPLIFLMGDIGDENISDEEIREEFRQAAEKGISVMLLMYKLDTAQVKLCVELADKYGMATIGELGFTSYRDASSIGVESFVHITRYSLDMAPPELRKAVAQEPFSDNLDSPKWQYYRYLSNIDTAALSFKDHAKMLASYKGFVIPTMSLLYLDLPGHTNPWDDPLAYLIDADDINNPADKQSGNHNYDPVYQAAYTKMALKQMELANGYYRAGVKFLAGSAADVWGTMPGISLHSELELLKRAGLSNREVIDAATRNFSDAYGWKKGKIEKEFSADILILKSNPVDDLANLRDIEILIQGGKMIFKK